jgi:hypothetical protein
MAAQNATHYSPIPQHFARRFSNPWVITADFREARDIPLHHTKDFDRSDLFKGIFSGLLLERHCWMSNADLVFKQHRTPERWLVCHLRWPRLCAEFWIGMGNTTGRRRWKYRFQCQCRSYTYLWFEISKLLRSENGLYGAQDLFHADNLDL